MSRTVTRGRKGAAAGAEPRLRDRLRGLGWQLKGALLPARPSSSAPILVGGCGRSGTTLLQVVLDRHPDLVCVRETSVMQPGRLNPGKLAARVGVPLERVHALAASSARHPEFVERLLAERCAAEGVSRWADKSPRNVRRLRYIFRHFPRARFVHVLRDGRDAVCSLRRHPRWGRVDDEVVELGTWNPVDECARRWVDDVRAGLAWRGHPGYRELRYEDLIRAPEPTLRALLEWLELRWEPSILQADGARQETGRTPEFHQALDTRSLGRWRRDLGPQDVATVKRLAGELLVELGYADDLSWEAEGPGAAPPSGAQRG